jgi:hypothetical protein
MKIEIANSSDDSVLNLREQLTDWCYAVIPGEKPEACLLEHDHWLGSSRDGSVWGLAIDFEPSREGYPEPDPHSDKAPDKFDAFLLDPPKRQEDVIQEILFRVHVASLAGPPNAKAIEKIIAAVPFREFRRVEEFLPEAPKDWLDLPAELVLGVNISEHVSIPGNFWEQFRRETLRDAVEVVCSPRISGFALNYTLAAREVIPLLRWDLSWPLSRRGKRRPEKREAVQGSVPWEHHADTSLLTIYQSVPGGGEFGAPDYFSEPTIRLQVGGRTSDQAITGWHQCAKPLRKIRANLGPLTNLYDQL